MKRLLLPASALVLVLTACGAGSTPAPRVTKVGARTSSIHAIVARRESAALAEARKLVGEFVPPPGARRDRARRDHGGILHRSGIAPLGESVTALRFWLVREPLADVLAFVKAHGLHGFRLVDSTYGTGQPHYLLRTLAWPPSRFRQPTRYLDETIAGLPGRTVIRIEAKVAWTYPRSPKERVPARTSEIVVRSPKVSVDVKSPAKVALISRWFDALPISPPGIAVACPAVGTLDATLSFRSAGGARLALAFVPLAAPANICNTIRFDIGGRPQKALIDSDRRPSFFRRLERLLGVHFLHKSRR